MGQVPTYLIIGSGRVAKHMQRYLDLLHLPYQSWSRQANSLAELVQLSERCSPILLLIKDSALAEVRTLYPCLAGKNLIHFSGQLSLEGIHAAHPLMSFVPDLYPLETYQKIPFILGEEAPDLATLLPGLANPAYRISNKQRSYYHALCVISGNFTALLWQKFFTEIERQFQIPKEQTYPYLQQVTANLMNAAQQALTGPLVRGDQATIAAHLQALEGDEYKKIYQAFVDVYQTIKK